MNSIVKNISLDDFAGGALAEQFNEALMKMLKEADGGLCRNKAIAEIKQYFHDSLVDSEAFKAGEIVIIG